MHKMCTFCGLGVFIRDAWAGFTLCESGGWDISDDGQIIWCPDCNRRIKIMSKYDDAITELTTMMVGPHKYRIAFVVQEPIDATIVVNKIMEKIRDCLGLARFDEAKDNYTWNYAKSLFSLYGNYLQFYHVEDLKKSPGYRSHGPNWNFTFLNADGIPTEDRDNFEEGTRLGTKPKVKDILKTKGAK